MIPRFRVDQVDGVLVLSATSDLRPQLLREVFSELALREHNITHPKDLVFHRRPAAPPALHALVPDSPLPPDVAEMHVAAMLQTCHERMELLVQIGPRQWQALLDHCERRLEADHPS